LISENSYLRVAKIIGPHSLDGKLKIHVISDIAERFEKGGIVYLGVNDAYKKFIISGFIPVKKRIALLKLEGIDDRNSAEIIGKAEIFIDKSTAEAIRSDLDEDTFFYQDLIGCSVLYEKFFFGTVIDILEGSSVDILIIETEDKDNNKQILIPFVESMVDTSNIEKKEIEINPIEGLIDI
jgi:16S rRNA processing protein RimM